MPTIEDQIRKTQESETQRLRPIVEIVKTQIRGRPERFATFTYEVGADHQKATVVETALPSHIRWNVTAIEQPTGPPRVIIKISNPQGPVYRLEQQRPFDLSDFYQESKPLRDSPKDIAALLQLPSHRPAIPGCAQPAPKGLNRILRLL